MSPYPFSNTPNIPDRAALMKQAVSLGGNIGRDELIPPARGVTFIKEILGRDPGQLLKALETARDAAISAQRQCYFQTYYWATMAALPINDIPKTPIVHFPPGKKPQFQEQGYLPIGAPLTEESRPQGHKRERFEVFYWLVNSADLAQSVRAMSPAEKEELFEPYAQEFLFQAAQKKYTHECTLHDPRASREDITRTELNWYEARHQVDENFDSAMGVIFSCFKAEESGIIDPEDRKHRVHVVLSNPEWRQDLLDAAIQLSRPDPLDKASKQNILGEDIATIRKNRYIEYTLVATLEKYISGGRSPQEKLDLKRAALRARDNRQITPENFAQIDGSLGSSTIKKPMTASSGLGAAANGFIPPSRQTYMRHPGMNPPGSEM